MTEIKRIKFLVDVNIEKRIVDFLIEKGFDVKCVVDINKQMSDVYLCEIANNEQRIVLTNDKDFGEIVFLQKKISNGIILLRVKNQDSFEKVILLGRLLDSYSNKITNHFVVITKERFRFIPLEVL